VVLLDTNWYPGQMAKAKKTLRENIKLVDLVIEILDARIPQSSHNPDLTLLLKQCPRLVVLNKSDLAERPVTRDWVEYLQEAEKITATSANSREGEGVYNLIRLLKTFSPWGKGGKRLQRPLRVMVVGIPNVGKSTVVNRLSRGSSARTGSRPGITRGKQWIRIHNDLELLDTPGILWPKFTGKELGFHLAAVGAIQEDIYDEVDVAYWLLEPLLKRKQARFKYRYDLEEADLGNKEKILASIGRARGCLKARNEVDIRRAAGVVLQDFRTGRLGPLTLESPPPRQEWGQLEGKPFGDERSSQVNK